MAYQNIDKRKILNAIKGDMASRKLLGQVLAIAGPAAIWRYEPDVKKGGGWDLSWPKGNQITLKTQESYITDIIAKYKTSKLIQGKVADGAITLLIGPQRVKFEKTGATTDASGKKISEATMTRMQELGSAWVFKRAIQDNVDFSSPAVIKNDKVTMDELKRIWKTIGGADEVGDDWIDTFYKQNKTLLKKIGRPVFTEFNREGGFMDWVSDFVKTKYGVSKKDNWNPADIWLIQNEDRWKKVIMDITSPNGRRGRRSQTLEELNTVFRTLFRQRQIFGVSLKKISGKEAQYEEVNVRESFFQNIESMTFSVDKLQSFCGIKEDGFQTQDTRMFVVDGAKTYNFQIKANTSTKMSGLKYEPTASGAGAARLGKATVELVVDLLKDNGFTFKKSADDYPKTADEFLKKESVYKKMFADLLKAQVNFGTASTTDDVFNNFLYVFGTQPHVANSKLQQLTFLHLATSLSSDELDEFGTDMVWLAMKAGRRYGPFAKLY
jgi:hypothetical protein